jgi:hypothetical protein
MILIWPIFIIYFLGMIGKIIGVIKGPEKIASERNERLLYRELEDKCTRAKTLAEYEELCKQRDEVAAKLISRGENPVAYTYSHFLRRRYY